MVVNDWPASVLAGEGAVELVGSVLVACIVTVVTGVTIVTVVSIVAAVAVMTMVTIVTLVQIVAVVTVLWSQGYFPQICQNSRIAWLNLPRLLWTFLDTTKVRPHHSD